MAVIDTLDQILASAANNGPWVRSHYDQLSAATTAATTTSGYLTGQRYARTVTVPSMGAGIPGMYLVGCRVAMVVGGVVNPTLVALEYTLGTLTVGGAFAAGSAMPTKTIRGSSLQTATVLPMLYVSSTLTATSPVVTITYTDQDGATGNTAALTLPTNALVNSVFQIAPHLAANDTGIRAVTNISISTGSAGELKVIGVLPLGWGLFNDFLQGLSALDPLAAPLPVFLCETNEKIAFYRFGRTNANEGMWSSLVGVAG